MKIHRYFDPVSLAADLARRLADDLRAASRAEGQASLVVSGGQTPVPLFSRLAAQDLAWERVWITLADERWVDVTDPASNEALVRQHLLQGGAARARFVGLKNRAPTPEEGQAAAEQALSLIPRPFTAVILGLGEDGHTASLFPQAPGIAAALDPQNRAACVAVRPPAAAHPRLSLTLSALAASRQVILHFTGALKWAVLEQALQPGLATALPIRAVLQAAGEHLEIYWAEQPAVG